MVYKNMTDEEKQKVIEEALLTKEGQIVLTNVVVEYIRSRLTQMSASVAFSLQEIK